MCFETRDARIQRIPAAVGIEIRGGFALQGVLEHFHGILQQDLLVEKVLHLDVTKAVSVTLGIVIAADCVMTLFGSFANDAAFNAWLTDSTDSTNRGAAEGINAMMPLVAILVVFGGFMFFDFQIHCAKSSKHRYPRIGFL